MTNLPHHSLCTRAVVLAAGRGTRMMPLTADRPKPLIPIAGVPILERILRGVQRAGVEEALIIHGYLGAMIEDYFETGARLGLRLSYQRQYPPNGTAGAVLQAEAWCGTAPFLLHWGDILVSPANYPAILALYAAHPPAAVIGLNWMDDPAAGAAVYLDGDRITDLIEKPPPGTSTTHWNNAGVMIHSPRIWPYLHQVIPSPRGELEVTDALHAMLAAGESLLGYHITGLWSDVGTPATVAELEEVLSVEF